MTKQKFIALLMVLLLLFGVFTPAAHAVEIVDVPFTAAPSPDDVFLATGIAEDAWEYWQSAIGATSPMEFSNQILIDYGPNWSSHPAAQNRYCYVFSGMPNMVYSDFYGYTSEDALSPDNGIVVTDYWHYIHGQANQYFDTYISSTMTFVFRAPYAIVWNDGVTANSYVEAETYTDPEGGIQYDLQFYADGEYYWPNSEYTYEMSVAIFDDKYDSYPVIVFAQNGLVPYEYYYSIYEDGSEYQITMESDPDFVFGDGVGTPEVPGTDIDVEGIENRLDVIIDNQNEQMDITLEQTEKITEQTGVIDAIRILVTDIKDKVIEMAENIATLPDTIADAIAAALENIEVGGDDSGNGRNFFDMIVDIVDRIMDLLEHAFDGIVEFFQSILEYMAAIGEVVVEYLLNALTQLASILELILMVPGWITTVLGFLPPEFANFISICVSVLFVVLLIKFAINIIK